MYIAKIKNRKSFALPTAMLAEPRLQYKKIRIKPAVACLGFKNRASPNYVLTLNVSKLG